MSPRKFAKAVLFHTRRAQIRSLAAPRALPWLRRRLHLPANDIFEPLAGSLPADARVVRLDPAGQFQRPLPSLPGASAEAVDFFSHRRLEETAPTYVAELDHGVAWGHPTGGIFTSGGCFAPAFTHDPAGARQHTVWTRLRLPAPRRLPGTTLYLVTPEATDNFHHWLIDLLPRLGLVRRAGYNLAAFDHVIVNHAGRGYQRSTLEQLGLPMEKIINASEALLVQCDTLVVPSLKSNHQNLPPADLAFLRETFLEPAPVVSRHRKLFLTRNDAAFRRLRNETDLYPLLRAHDFEIFSPAGVPLREQARLFSEAAVVAGPAGAAFANLVFANAPAQVIEIAPPQWLSAFHWMISARLGLAHTILLGEGRVMQGVPDSSARQADIFVQPDRLAALLSPTSAMASS